MREDVDYLYLISLDDVKYNEPSLFSLILTLEYLKCIATNTLIYIIHEIYAFLFILKFVYTKHSIKYICITPHFLSRHLISMAFSRFLLFIIT